MPILPALMLLHDICFILAALLTWQGRRMQRTTSSDPWRLIAVLASGVSVAASYSDRFDLALLGLVEASFLILFLNYRATILLKRR